MCALVIVEPMFKLVPKDAPKSAQQKYPKHQKLGFASKKMFGKTFQKILSHMVVEWQFYHGTLRKKITPKNGHNTNFRVPNPQVTVTSSNPTGFFFGGETSTTIKKYYGSSGCWWFPPWKNTPPPKTNFKTLDFCCLRRPKKIAGLQFVPPWTRPRTRWTQPQCWGCSHREGHDLCRCFGLKIPLRTMWDTLPKANIAPAKMVVKRLVWFWEGQSLGASC